MDGHTSREIRKGERLEDRAERAREAEEAEEEARRRDEAQRHFPPFAVTVRIVDFGSLKALVSIKMMEMEIRGFKVIEKPDGGRYVAPPTREVYRDGKPEYFNLVRLGSKEATQKFRRLILDAYDAELQAPEEE
jgi:hypothetical protein